jgi:hypothetical protein
VYSHRFEQAVVTHCAPALTGLKPASLISLPAQEYPRLSRLAAEYTRVLGCRGLRFEVLCRCNRRFLLLVYRPARLAACVEQEAVAALLARAGYPTGAGLAGLLNHLRRRLLEGDGFPHEIGLFLGYPAEDVLGFLADRGGCTLCGYWKVYHNEQQARRRFAQFDRCRDILRARLAAGYTLAQLFGGAARAAA